MLANVATLSTTYATRQRDEIAARMIAEREEREAIALVDAGREDEERERQDGQPDEQGEPVRSSGDHPQDERDHHERRVVPMATAGTAPNTARARAAVARYPGAVADPLAGIREAVAGVARDERPRIEGVDREVRVAAGSDRDLLEEPDARYGG